MEPFGIGITGLGAAGAATLGAFGLAFRSRRRRLAAELADGTAIGPGTGIGAEIGAASGAPDGPRPQTQRERIEAIATAQAELALRLDALTAAGSAPEERLQAMAGQLLGLIRDKNATLETAMAGLDQLRARMKALEELGEPAEARGLFEGLKSRMGELETRAAASSAALEARLAALASGGGASELAERLARLHEARDAGLEAALGRLAPLETRLAGLESGLGAGREVTRRLEAALAALHGEQASARSEIAALRAVAESGPLRAERAAEVAAERVRTELAPRIEAFERALAGQDPAGALDRFAERLEAVQDRLVLIETAENPLAEVSERLAGLYAQKDAGIEAMLGRLAPLEAKLDVVERGLAAQDPAGALDRVAERLEGLAGRLTRVEMAESPLAAVSAMLAQVHAQKEAALDAVLARLGPLEERLGAFERETAAKDPRAALEQVTARLEAVAGRVSLIEMAEDPVAEISATLAALHAQKDVNLETLLGRLAPIEARLGGFERELAAQDPAGALDRFAERLDGVAGRVTRIEAAETPLAEISAALAALHAEKDAAVEAALARLAPIEARLGGFERELAVRDPAGALDRFAERLDGVAGRLALVETAQSAENPLAEVSERLAGLYAQKDAGLEAVLSRLAPLEAKLAAVEGGLERVAGDDPRPAVEGLRSRIEALHWSLGETAAGLAALKADAAAGGGFVEVADQLTRLLARKDAGLEAMLGRLAPLEAALARVATLEGALGRLGPIEAAIERLGPLETAIERLSPLETALERLSPLETAVQRIAPLETAVERVGPIEARLNRLGAIEIVLARIGPLEAAAERLGPLEAAIERLGALEATLGRIGPLEARLAALEGRDDPDVARAVAVEVAAELATLRADAATQTALFADRLALLEAGLPKLDTRQAVKRGATMEEIGVEEIAAKEVAGKEIAGAPAAPAGEMSADEAEEAIWALPRIISLHK